MEATPQQLSPEAALPILIGVTGHRDLRPVDLSSLRARIEQVIRELLRRYPQTPLIVVSPLAEGADRLVANVALEHGARLAVPLPLPVAEYERDFATLESRKEFQALLKRAWRCFELPLVKGNTTAGIHEYGPARDSQYALAGAYIARHSQILIALWDGTHTDLVGGTAQIVNFKLNGISQPYDNSSKPLDIID